MTEESSKDDRKMRSTRLQPVAKAKFAPPSVPGRLPQDGDRNIGISVRFVLWVFQKWWKLVLPAGLLLAGISAAIVINQHVPSYQASAWIIIEAEEPYIAFDRGAGVAPSTSRFIQTQIELLRSPIVLGNVISRPDVGSLDEMNGLSDRLTQLESNLSINQVGASELYKIQYVSPSPESARVVVNAVVAEYLSSQTNEDYGRAQRVISLLDEESRRRSPEVERQRNRVMELAKDISVTDPFGQGAMIDPGKSLSPVATLGPALVELDVNREVLKAEIQALREAPALGLDRARSSGLLDLEIGGREDVRNQEEAIAAIRSRIADFRATRKAWKGQPAYIRLMNDLDAQEAELADLKFRLREELLDQRRADGKREHQESITSLERELVKLNSKKKLLSEQFEKHKEELKDSGAKSVQFEFAHEELKRGEKIFELIATRKLALQTELRAPARVRLRQEATVPLQPLDPLPYKLLVVSCLAAFAAPLGIAVTRELTMRRISDSDQLAQESKLRVLGEVARIPVRHVAAESSAISQRVRQEMFVFTESIDSLRTSLDLSEYLGSNNVLAITSATTGEGKTSVAISLAQSVANATNQSTLILDGDLRKESIPLLPDGESTPGLVEVLKGECSLKDAIYRIGESNTYCLPSGRSKVNPHRLVRAPRIAQLLDELRPMFSVIVIDTPPILVASEALVFAKAADAVIFCSLRDVSRSRQVCSAVERLEFTGANVLGAVLSGTTLGRYGYSYRYRAYQNEV